MNRHSRGSAFVSGCLNSIIPVIHRPSQEICLVEVWRQSLKHSQFCQCAYLVEDALKPYQQITTIAEFEDLRQEALRLLWELVTAQDETLEFKDEARKAIEACLRSVRRATNRQYRIVEKMAQLELGNYHSPSLDDQIETEELHASVRVAVQSLSSKHRRVITRLFGIGEIRTPHKQLATQEQLSRQSLWKLKREAYRKLSKDEALQTLMQ
jgi:hypothetical protein